MGGGTENRMVSYYLNRMVYHQYCISFSDHIGLIAFYFRNTSSSLMTFYTSIKALAKHRKSRKCRKTHTTHRKSQIFCVSLWFFCIFCFFCVCLEPFCCVIGVRPSVLFFLLLYSELPRPLLQLRLLRLRLLLLLLLLRGGITAYHGINGVPSR